MIKGKFEIFLDTDLFIEAMTTKDSSFISGCRELFEGCYTSAVNCSEIFSECINSKDMNRAKDLFNGIGILGIPFRYSLKIGEVLKAIKKKGQETLLETR